MHLGPTTWKFLRKSSFFHTPPLFNIRNGINSRVRRSFSGKATGPTTYTNSLELTVPYHPPSSWFDRNFDFEQKELSAFFEQEQAKAKVQQSIHTFTDM